MTAGFRGSTWSVTFGVRMDDYAFRSVGAELDWDAVIAITSIVQGVVVVITAVIVVLQLRDDRRIRRSEATLRLLEDLTSPEARNERLAVYQRFTSMGGPYTDGDRLAADAVLGRLDRVQVQIDRDILDREVVADLYGEMILHLWAVLTPYVESERVQRRSPSYRTRAQKLAGAMEESGATWAPPAAA